MSGTVITLLVVLGILLAIVISFVSCYNGLVQFRNRLKNAWSQIDVQLKRRHDLIPNLVETVKGFAAHEQETLTGVIEARGKAVNANGVEAKAQAEGELNSALSRLMMVVEQYPQLQANENFMSLQEELTSTENKITFARQHFNDSVMQFNNKVESIPTNVVASLFNFSKEKFFEVKDEKVREAPAVSF